MTAVDPGAARRAAASDDERRCAEVLSAALAGGSAAAMAELLAIGSAAQHPAQRDWARRLLLSLLRLEGEWAVLASLRDDHPELELSPNAVPTAMLGYPRADISPPTAAVRLPWREHASGLPIVEARLAGERGDQTLPVVLDIGAGTCAVTETVAERLGARFVSDQPLPVLGIAGGTSTARAAVLTELQLGTWTVHNVPVAVVPAEQLRAIGDDVPALIGWEVLQHVALELSPQGHEIVFDRSRTLAGGEPEPNLVLLSEPLVRLRCGDASVLLLLDTGSTFTMLTRDAVRRLGLASQPGGNNTLSGVGGDQQVDTDLVTRLPLQCGPTQFTLGNVGAYDRRAAPPGMPRIDGTIGMDVLATVRVVVDGPARTVTMQAQ
jgi:hypothetical protein